MPIFSRRIPYDRKRMLVRASGLEVSWRWRRALALYRQILAAEPDNGEIHARVAPLLARSGRQAEAWASFKIAAATLDQKGDEAAARALRLHAARTLPASLEAHREVARAELTRGRREAAIKALVRGAEILGRRRKRRGAAILLLREARALENWNPRIVLPLARLLHRDGFAAEALYLLDHLDQKVEGEAQRATRKLAWRIEPSLAHSWRWLKLVWTAHREGRLDSQTSRASSA